MDKIYIKNGLRTIIGSNAHKLAFSKTKFFEDKEEKFLIFRLVDNVWIMIAGQPSELLALHYYKKNDVLIIVEGE